MGNSKLTLLFLTAVFFLSVESIASTLQLKVSEKPSDKGTGLCIVFESKAQGNVTYSVTGLGVIKSGELEEGATAEIRFKREGIAQFKVGEGKNQESGVVPVRTANQGWILITGTAFVPQAEPPSTASQPSLEFQPLTGDEFQFKNPYGAAFDKLSTPEKIRLVQTSSETSQLTRDEKRNLLGFLHNQKGVEEANAKKFTEAEKSLRTAIDYMGDHSSVSANLAYVIAVQGNNAALAGDLRTGESQLTEALKILENVDNSNLESQIHSSLAGVYTKRGLDLPSTERSKKEAFFRKALEFEPSQPVALFELGQIAYANYELAKALDFYEASFRVNQDPALATLIQKVKTEFAEAGDFKTQDRGAFKISFQGRETKEVADRTRDLLADAQRDVGRSVGLRPNDTIPVVIYSAGQFQNILGLHSWAGAAYDGKIRLPIADLTDQELKEGETRVRQIVYHEYTHAVLQSHLDRQSVPIWFHEGLAQLASGETPPIGDPNWVIRGLSTGMVPTPSEMTGQFSDVRDGQMASALYFVSFSFMRYLVEEHGGWSRLRRLIDRLIAGDGMVEGFKSTYRRTLQDIEADWLLALERRDPAAF